jgi:hypothetical protein
LTEPAALDARAAGPLRRETCVCTAPKVALKAMEERSRNDSRRAMRACRGFKDERALLLTA